ncbi:growth-regulating factor 9 [Raphanus sativus]|nr:growth-regulating factor 9 [Raphanus sativus]
MQALVYRYIEAGLRVPHHLVVPIWNSLALSSSSTSSYLIHYNHHSSSLLNDKVDPEPTRCRRTDGKKWRCSNKVLLLQKYCERHMHRGRKRSRKLVESSPSSYDVASSSVSTKRDNTDGLASSSKSQSETMSVSSNAQVVTIASLPTARVCDNVTRPSLVITESTNRRASNLDRSRRVMDMSYDDFIKQRGATTCVRGFPVQGPERLPSVQKFFPEASDTSSEAARFSSNRKNEIIARSREWKNMNVNGSLFPNIHFSPDTVLQDRGGFGLHRVETENEPGRCRRTDGKKWRCSKDVLSGQKYCDKHMHRGSVKKKHPVETTHTHENASFIRVTVRPDDRSVPCKDDGDGQKLPVSVLGREQLSQVSDEKNTNSCSTDTTVTDIALRCEDNEEVLSLCSSGV